MRIAGSITAEQFTPNWRHQSRRTSPPADCSLFGSTCSAFGDAVLDGSDLAVIDLAASVQRNTFYDKDCNFRLTLVCSLLLAKSWSLCTSKLSDIWKEWELAPLEIFDEALNCWYHVRTVQFLADWRRCWSKLSPWRKMQLSKLNFSLSNSFWFVKRTSCRL